MFSSIFEWLFIINLQYLLKVHFVSYMKERLTTFDEADELRASHSVAETKVNCWHDKNNSSLRISYKLSHCL